MKERMAGDLFKAAGERGVYICLKGALVWLRKQLDAVQDWS